MIFEGFAIHQALAHYRTANLIGSQQPLVASAHEQVRLDAREIEFRRADGLRAIDDEESTYLAWEDTYWAGATANSPFGWRWMLPYAFGDAVLYQLGAGWLDLDRRRTDLAEGTFAVTGYSGEFAAEHCGVW